MESRFEVTREMMEKAQTYIPIAMKEFIASDVARACIKRTKLIHNHEIEEESEDNPYGISPVYCESSSTKARVLMTILMVFYLEAWSDDTPMLCALDDYDKVASAHVLNQIERYKTTDLREKAFDLISDYREMEKYLNSAIYSVLREVNDPIARLIEALGQMGSEEGLEKALETIQETQEEIGKERERQERIIRGEEGEEGDG